MEKLKLCVLISGRGSNLQTRIHACASPDFPATIGLGLSNKASAAGLGRAAAAGIPTQVFDHKAYASRAEFDRNMTQAMQEIGTELVCLAGFMRLLSDEFCDHWRDRMINIHPSLLPAFKGLDVQQAALDAGVRFAGCTVHYVRKEMETGPVLWQAVVPILPEDTADTLAARILIEEHKIYPAAVRLIAEDRVSIIHERALINGHQAPVGSLINPTLDG